jgi:type IV pilus assembly protein PilA
MFARIRKAMEEREEGFTLIELLVVIIIIGILAAIAIPVFLNQRKKGYDAAVKSDLRNFATAEETYNTDNNFYTSTVSALTATGYDFKYSNATNYTGGTAVITVPTLYDATGASGATGTAATGGFCAQATSASGKTWKYNSVTGGLQSGGCP